MLVGARHDKPVEPLRRQFPAQAVEARRTRQKFEILGREAVAVPLRPDRPQPLERGSQSRCDRVGYQHVPARPDLGGSP